MKTEARIILTGAMIVILFGLLSSALIKNNSSNFARESTAEGNFACTMDAKVCPDGTYVGRIPPYCQFAACPYATTIPLYDIE
jgi:hypothetical protein